MNDESDDRRKYIEQQSELFPEDFYIRGRGEAASAESTGGEVNREIPPYEPPESGILSEYEQQICECKRCPLGESRTKFVFGAGSPDADLLFVGEAPGREEDMQGIPFVGRAGNLLEKILAAIDLTREQVYIANILKCRPPNNRDPNQEEIEACEPYLVEQIKMIEPEVIIALGRVSATTLLNKSMALRDLRERTWNYHGTDLVATYHPAALLRNPNLKRPAWEDFQRIQARYLQG